MIRSSNELYEVQTLLVQSESRQYCQSIALCAARGLCKSEGETLPDVKAPTRAKHDLRGSPGDVEGPMKDKTIIWITGGALLFWIFAGFASVREGTYHFMLVIWSHITDLFS